MPDVLLRDGAIAHVRPLRPDDRDALHALVSRSSDRSAYLRFFAGGTATAHGYMDRITKPGYKGHALVAMMQGRLVAVAEYFDNGDMAILIDDAVHGHGLGTLLLEHVAIDATEHGVRELTADVLTENAPMLRVLRDLGLEVERAFDGNTLHIKIILAPTAQLVTAIEAREHEAERASLARLLAPGSVAVVGASRDGVGPGSRVLRNLADFPGEVYPINPNADRLADRPCYPKVSVVPGHVDLAVIAVPARHVLDVARDCASAGVAGLVVLTSGFAEAGLPDAEQELLSICRTAGMRLVGPNCLGVINTTQRLNASFLPMDARPGAIGLLSQSGAVAAAVVDRLAVAGMGLSSFVSVGNKADVSGNDLLEYWEDDPATHVIALYLESFGNPRKFTRIAQRVGRTKPVLLVKSGRTDAGSAATRSHTAAAATPDIAVDALVRASGVIRLDTVQDLIDVARLLATQPLPTGRRVAIVGNSGGPEAMAADACERHGLAVPRLSLDSAGLPSGSALGNPVDLTSGATADEIGRAITLAVADSEVDVVLAVYTPPFGSGQEATRKAIAEATRDVGKPVVTCVIGQDGLIDDRIPSYAFPEQAVSALAHVVRYAEWRARPDTPSVPGTGATARAARMTLSGEPADGWLSQSAVRGLLHTYGVHLAESRTVTNADDAVQAADRLGLPVVLKAEGPLHKTEAGGVRLDLRSLQEVREAYRDMAARLGPAMTGATVQPMLAHGVEIIIGGVSYPAFGPLVMVGMGGVTADLLADRSFRVPPVTAATAEQMIRELRCSPLLYGYRGSRPVAVDVLIEQLTRVAHLLDELPEIAELDLNPVIVTPYDAIAVDARIRLAPCDPPPSPLLRRLR
ncbi:GNAT family N-acetyltransferase [Streptosporangiaceae bacterium NEAU-GS5]|nr:GNAT family N-acetyltransferase [Streptosporangiaceae bacterium NEAU-GS5]